MINIEQDSEGHVRRTLEDPPLARLLFQNSGMAWVWFVVRLWLGWQWLAASWMSLSQPGEWLPFLAAVAQVVFAIAIVVGLFVGASTAGGLVVHLLVDLDPLQVAAAILLLLAWKNAGLIGLDRYVLRAFGAPWWDTEVPHIPRGARTHG
jgi:thiosulfate dehydrogenase (quinone) large subunit